MCRRVAGRVRARESVWARASEGRVGGAAVANQCGDSRADTALARPVWWCVRSGASSAEAVFYLMGSREKDFGWSVPHTCPLSLSLCFCTFTPAPSATLSLSLCVRICSHAPPPQLLETRCAPPPHLHPVHQRFMLGARRSRERACACTHHGRALPSAAYVTPRRCTIAMHGPCRLCVYRIKFQFKQGLLPDNNRIEDLSARGVTSMLPTSSLPDPHRDAMLTQPQQREATAAASNSYVLGFRAGPFVYFVAEECVFDADKECTATQAVVSRFCHRCCAYARGAAHLPQIWRARPSKRLLGSSPRWSRGVLFPPGVACGLLRLCPDGLGLA